MATLSHRTHLVRSPARCGLLALAATVALSGCLRLKIDNKPPIAEIWANGMLVAKSGNAITTTTIPYMGMPVSVVLDATKSSDPDGQVTSFKWLRSDIPAGSRWADGGVPPADSGLPVFHTTDDPPSGNAAQLTLDNGKYRYSLWVMDNGGLISAPATVTLQIGEAPMAPPKFMPMPDATCSAKYMSPKKGCSACVCTPNAMGGCLDAMNLCYNNPDAMFATLCSAVVNCAIAKSCAGNACFTQPNPCSAEITAAATYMGGTIDQCGMAAMAATNPCAASTALAACTTAMTSMCASSCQ